MWWDKFMGDMSVDENCYENMRSALYGLKDYVHFISDNLVEVLSEIKNDKSLFDSSEFVLLDVDYYTILFGMKEYLSGESRVSGISLTQSLDNTIKLIEKSDDAVYDGAIYEIDSNEKIKINLGKIGMLSDYIEQLKGVRESFDRGLYRSLIYKDVLQRYLGKIDNLDHEVENRSQFENESEKTKFLIKSSLLIYVGLNFVFEKLIDINKDLCDNGFWVVGSDFIENIDVSFINSDRTISFVKDIIKNEFRLSSYLGKSIDPEVMAIIENEISDEFKSEKVDRILEAVCDAYSPKGSQLKSNI